MPSMTRRGTANGKAFRNHSPFACYILNARMAASAKVRGCGLLPFLALCSFPSVRTTQRLGQKQSVSSSPDPFWLGYFSSSSLFSSPWFALWPAFRSAFCRVFAVPGMTEPAIATSKTSEKEASEKEATRGTAASVRVRTRRGRRRRGREGGGRAENGRTASTRQTASTATHAIERWRRETKAWRRVEQR